MRDTGNRVNRLNVVGSSIAVGLFLAVMPASLVGGVESPKAACKLLTKATATGILKSNVKIQGGSGYICRYQGSNGSRLVVTDVPNTQKWRSAIQPAVAAGDVGVHQNASIGGARGYSVAKRYGSSVGVAYYMTYRGYFVAVGVFGNSNNKSAAKSALTKALPKL